MVGTVVLSDFKQAHSSVYLSNFLIRTLQHQKFQFLQGIYPRFLYWNSHTLWKDLGVQELCAEFHIDDPLETGPLVATHSRGIRHRWKFNACKTLGLRLPQWFYQLHFKHFEARTKTPSSSSLHGKLEVTTKMKPCNTPETTWDCGIHCLQTLLENGWAGFVVETPFPPRVPDFSKHALTFAFPPLLPTSSSWLLPLQYMVSTFTWVLILLQTFRGRYEGWRKDPVSRLP